MRAFVIGLSLLLLAACQTTTQTTSGTDYLAKHPPVDANKEASFEETLRQVANVEPKLTFPARIGLARIDRSSSNFNQRPDLTVIPAEEAEAWKKVRAELGPDFGEFVPLSPLVAQLAAEGIASKNQDARYEVMNKIRIGAARQHLDAVLIYETFSTEETKSNALSIADITIIGGYLLPTKSTEVKAYADAMLIDVIQGYPYGTVDTTIDADEMISSRWGWGSDSRKDFAEEAKIKAAIKLSDEVEAMIKKLRAELEAQHSAKL